MSVMWHTTMMIIRGNKIPKPVPREKGKKLAMEAKKAKKKMLQNLLITAQKPAVCSICPSEGSLLSSF